MVAALEDGFNGQGRFRIKKATISKLPSHYEFARWDYDEGKRYAVPVGGVRSDKRPEFPLISTALKNESTGTYTLLWIHFDLDFKRADKKWRVDGKLDWPSMAKKLQAEVPELFKHLTAVTRSSGGHGLGLVLAISPLELIDETADIQKYAFRLQSWIIQILNHYGMGADEGARGLRRLMPSIFQPERLIDRDEVTEKIIQTKRPRVIQNLLYALKFHPALTGQNKRDRDDILWPDIRVELPCARLYTDLLDSVGPWGTSQLTVQEIITRYGMSKNTAYKFLADPPKWLGVEHISGEGYRLTIRPSREMTDRAYDLIETGGEGRAKGSFASFTTALICSPENVVDGERNQWVVSVVLACKWKGIARSELLSALQALVRRVPGYSKSQSLTRELPAIVRSLYHHRSNLIGKDPDLILPDWLSEALTSPKPNRLSQNFHKKGSLRDLKCGLSASVVIPEPFLEVLSSESTPFPPTPVGRGLGVWGEQAPAVLVETSSLDADHSLCDTGISRISFSQPAVESEQLEFEPATYAVRSDPVDETGPSCPSADAGNTFVHLSGRELSGAFSKALMKSQLPAAEKGRILTLVTSEMDLGKKDQMRREWLVRLSLETSR